MKHLLQSITMQDVRLDRKLSVVALVLALAAVLAIAMVHQLTTAAITVARQAHLGLELHAGLRELQRNLQIHRGSSNAKIAGVPGSKEKNEAARTAADDAMVRIDSFLVRHADPFNSQDRWLRIAAAWQALKALPDGISATVNVAYHNALIDDLLGLLEQTVVKSGMLLDPDHHTYFLISALAATEPRATADFGQLRSVGLLLMSQQSDEEAYQRLLDLIVLSKERAGVIHGGLAAALDRKPELVGALQSMVSQELIAADAFFAAAGAITRNPFEGSMTLEQYFSLGETATAMRYQLYEAGIKAVSQQIQWRIEALSQRRLASMGGVGFALFLSLGLLGLVLQDVNRRLRTAAGAAGELAEGRLQNVILAEGRDEIGRLTASIALAGMQLKAFSEAEIEMTQAQEQGNSRFQINAARFPGAYGEIAKQLNCLVQAHLDEQARIIETVEAYIRGELSREPPALLGDKAQITHTLEEVRQFQAVFHESPAAQSFIDSRTLRYLRVNAAWVDQTGYPSEQVIGRRGNEFGLISAEQLGLVAKAHEEGKQGLTAEEMTLTRRDGERLVCLTWTRHATVRNSDLIIFWQIDITQQRAVQAQIQEMNASLELTVERRTSDLKHTNEELQGALDNLRSAQNLLVQSEKLAALGRLVAGIAHELNTPIGNSLLSASTLAEHTATFARQSRAGNLKRSALDGFVAHSNEAVQILQRNLERAAHLISSFKQVAADQSSDQRRRFQLKEVIEEVLLAHRPVLRTGHRINIDVPAGISMDSYPGPLGQVIGNIITNAVIHAFEDRTGGTITVTAHTGGINTVEISIKDDGCGISEADLRHIFDPFFTTKMGRGGTGLGLSICHNLVTQMLGGSLHVQSTPGAGTTFIVQIPLIAPNAASLEAA